ncbi:hypothetical protein LCGC14_1375610 [marine sediment metagenome]|uniref:Uncharacterized protein n=1 Tax=marine sediment metagenome TaxID=412755 RepID=A0A0F9K4K1_9ZZZZ
MKDILRLDLTREQATIIHGIVMLHIVEHHPPIDPDLLLEFTNYIPKWISQAELTKVLIYEQCLGTLMRSFATFIGEDL